MSTYLEAHATVDRDHLSAHLRAVVRSLPGYSSGLRAYAVALGQFITVASMISTVEPSPMVTVGAYLVSGLVGGFITSRWRAVRDREERLEADFVSVVDDFLAGCLTAEAIRDRLCRLHPEGLLAFLPVFEDLSYRMKYSRDRTRLEELVEALRAEARPALSS